MSKRDILKMLWAAVNEVPEALVMRAEAARNKNKYWKVDEWIYIKDTEVSLRMLKKAMAESNISLVTDISQLILDGVEEERFLRNAWALEKISECRENMKTVSNPE
jgi:hypothetical protein